MLKRSNLTNLPPGFFHSQLYSIYERLSVIIIHYPFIQTPLWSIFKLSALPWINILDCCTQVPDWSKLNTFTHVAEGCVNIALDRQEHSSTEYSGPEAWAGQKEKKQWARSQEKVGSYRKPRHEVENLKVIYTWWTDEENELDGRGWEHGNTGGPKNWGRSEGGKGSRHIVHFESLIVLMCDAFSDVWSSASYFIIDRCCQTCWVSEHWRYHKLRNQ